LSDKRRGSDDRPKGGIDDPENQDMQQAQGVEPLGASFLHSARQNTKWLSESSEQLQHTHDEMALAEQDHLHGIGDMLPRTPMDTHAGVVPLAGGTEMPDAWDVEHNQVEHKPYRAWKRLLICLRAFLERSIYRLKAMAGATRAWETCVHLYRKLRRLYWFIFQANSDAIDAWMFPGYPTDEPLDPHYTSAEWRRAAEMDERLHRYPPPPPAWTDGGTDPSLHGKVLDIGRFHPWHEFTIDERCEILSRPYEHSQAGWQGPRDTSDGNVDSGPPGHSALDEVEAADFEYMLRRLFTWDRAKRASVHQIAGFE
jgi:hypothetical protein